MYLRKNSIQFQGLFVLSLSFFLNSISAFNLYLNDLRFTYEMLKASLLMIILIFVSKIKYPDILLKYIFYLFILS